ncbi:MAG: ECF-type sigma factor, partial [Planctomycetota bacterium]
MTHLIGLMKQGDDRALTELWQRYVHRLIGVARRQLSTYSSTLIDEEDILISVFDRLFKATQKNQFAKLENRDDLWQILVMLTERKVIDHQRRELAQKRGGDKIQPFSDLKLSIREFEELAENGPDPERAALFNESLAQALNRLGDER